MSDPPPQVLTNLTYFAYISKKLFLILIRIFPGRLFIGRRQLGWTFGRKTPIRLTLGRQSIISAHQRQAADYFKMRQKVLNGTGGAY